MGGGGGGGGDQIFIGLSGLSVTTYHNCIIKVREKQVAKQSDGRSASELGVYIV